MSAFRPPPPSTPGDSEPGVPSLPPLLLGDAGLWSEGDEETLHDPVAAFSTQSPDAADQRHPTIGHIGRYALKHQLGEGGLGTVYAAHDPLLSRLIAVKTLHVEIDAGERAAFNAMFLNEARAAAGLNHPHIVTVFDAGVSDERAYIAMELLKGRDLRQLRQEGWRATPTQAALIVRRVADALGYAHSKGVVHRDVKPANIFMIGRTQPKVLDFGIARIARHQHDHHDSHPAAGDIVAGSPYYMAPEQARRETVDRRADVFSLGVVLYELLTDTKPFRGDNLQQITEAVLRHEPPLANTLDAAVPLALAQITARAMAKNPEQRFRSARAFARELREWLESAAGASEGEPAVAWPTARPAGPRRLMPLVSALAGLGLIGMGWFMFGPHATPASEAHAATVPALPTAPATAPGATEPRPAASAVDSVASLPAAAGDALAGSPGAPDAAASGPAATQPLPLPLSISAAAPEPLPSALPARAATPAPAPAVSRHAAAAAKPTRDTAAERRAREAREIAAAVAAMPVGTVRVAISPWGEVEIDGKRAGTSPPLTELTLPAGRHLIVVRNTDLPPFSATVDVAADQPVTLKHKF